MNKNMKKYIGCFLALMLMILAFPMKGWASEPSCSINVNVSTKVVGEDAPEGTEFKLVFETLDESNPMPEVTTAVVKDSAEVQFGPMDYTLPEDYQYRVYQEAGDAECFTYDDTVYIVTVRVVNDGNGGLVAQGWAVKEGTDIKVDQIVFENMYEKPFVPEAPQTGDPVNVTVWASVMLVSLMIMLAVIFLRWREWHKYE